MLSQARADLVSFGRDLQRDGISMNIHRATYRAVRRAVGRLATTLDQVLAKPDPKP